MFKENQKNRNFTGSSDTVYEKQNFFQQHSFKKCENLLTDGASLHTESNGHHFIT